MESRLTRAKNLVVRMRVIASIQTPNGGLERERVSARKRRQKRADRLKYLETYASDLQTEIAFLKRRNAELEQELIYRRGI
jgi:hypothetical protein